MADLEIGKTYTDSAMGDIADPGAWRVTVLDIGEYTYWVEGVSSGCRFPLGKTDGDDLEEYVPLPEEGSQWERTEHPRHVVTVLWASPKFVAYEYNDTRYVFDTVAAQTMEEFLKDHKLKAEK